MSYEQTTRRSRKFAKLSGALCAIALLSLTACSDGGSDSGTGNNPPPSGNTSFAVGGSVAGLGSGLSLILSNNASDKLTVSADGNFAFSQRLADGAAYAVAVATQPSGLTCTVAQAQGNIAHADVTDVQVNCSSRTPAATTKGSVVGVAASAVIGATGGSVSTADGRASLSIPAGALSSTTTISIQPISNQAHGGRGVAYRLAPDGLAFAKPAQLQIRYAAADLQGTDDAALGIAFQDADGLWEWVNGASVDTGAKTITASIAHFSDWSAVAGWQLRPPSASVKVKGTVGLTVQYCFSPDIIDNGTAKGYQCDDSAADLTPLIPPIRMSNWSVNGTPGGNSTVGTVAGANKGATFTAPAKVPSSNPVAVSAQISSPKRGKTVLVSNINIMDAVGDYAATFSASGTYPGIATWSVSNAKITFKATETLPNDLIKYEGTGKADFTMNLDGCNPVTVSAPISGTFILYDPARNGPSDPYASAYDFAFLQNPAQIVNVTCGGASTSAPLITQAVYSYCSTNPLPPQLFKYTDDSHLQGTQAIACGALGSWSVTWDLLKQ